MTNLKQIAEAIMEIAKKNPDGFTIDKNLNHVKQGFSVADAITQNSFDESGLEHVVSVVYGENGHKFDGIGGWYNSANGKYYFDAVHIVESKDEAQHLGEANKQIAYYDLSCGEEHLVTYEFSVPLVKVLYCEADVVIRAKSMSEAENMALNMAYDDKVKFRYVAEEIKTC